MQDYMQSTRGTGAYAAYVGLDVHKDTSAAAVAPAGREPAAYRGEIAHRSSEVAKLARDLATAHGGEPVLFCYEAGPCGYGLYRQLRELGFDCDVAAPSRIPKAPAERIKTDRRDACKLARLSRGGELTAVWVPDDEQEAMRDLVRARADFKEVERKARQQLCAFLLRNGRRWSAGRWTQAHWAWLDGQRFERDWQEWAFRDYVAALRAASERVAAVTARMEAALAGWSMAPVVRSLAALRGVDRITAMTLMSELGDVSRFDNPRQLMAYLGLVPSEHSSGARQRRGAITLTGNGTARRALVESAWSYRFPARQTRHLQRKAAAASDEGREIAWRAQRRLCDRYRHLVGCGKNTKQANVAVARELAGFVWDIVRVEMARLPGAAARELRCRGGRIRPCPHCATVPVDPYTDQRDSELRGINGPMRETTGGLAAWKARGGGLHGALGDGFRPGLPLRRPADRTKPIRCSASPSQCARAQKARSKCRSRRSALLARDPRGRDGVARRGRSSPSRPVSPRRPRRTISSWRCVALRRRRKERTPARWPEAGIKHRWCSLQKKALVVIHRLLWK